MRFHMRTAHEDQSKFDYGIEDSGEIVNVCIICSDNVEPGVLCAHEKSFANRVDIKTCRVSSVILVIFPVIKLFLFQELRQNILRRNCTTRTLPYGAWNL